MVPKVEDSPESSKVHFDYTNEVPTFEISLEKEIQEPSKKNVGSRIQEELFSLGLLVSVNK